MLVSLHQAVTRRDVLGYIDRDHSLTSTWSVSPVGSISFNRAGIGGVSLFDESFSNNGYVNTVSNELSLQLIDRMGFSKGLSVDNIDGVWECFVGFWA